MQVVLRSPGLFLLHLRFQMLPFRMEQNNIPIQVYNRLAINKSSSAHTQYTYISIVGIAWMARPYP